MPNHRVDEVRVVDDILSIRRLQGQALREQEGCRQAGHPAQWTIQLHVGPQCICKCFHLSQTIALPRPWEYILQTFLGVRRVQMEFDIERYRKEQGWGKKTTLTS